MPSSMPSGAPRASGGSGGSGGGGFYSRDTCGNKPGGRGRRCSGSRSPSGGRSGQNGHATRGANYGGNGPSFGGGGGFGGYGGTGGPYNTNRGLRSGDGFSGSRDTEGYSSNKVGTRMRSRSPPRAREGGGSCGGRDNTEYREANRRGSGRHDAGPYEDEERRPNRAVAAPKTDHQRAAVPSDSGANAGSGSGPSGGGGSSTSRGASNTVAPTSERDRVSSSVPLRVSGCGDATIGEFITGIYIPDDFNHGRVVYKKERKTRGHDVLIYFWDERDGPDQCGWWFGPNVGGNQVWAYHASRTAMTPPVSEWNVPHDGKIDPSFSVTPVDSSSSSAHHKHRPTSRVESDAPRKQPRVDTRALTSSNLAGSMGVDGAGTAGGLGSTSGGRGSRESGGHRDVPASREIRDSRGGDTRRETPPPPPTMPTTPTSQAGPEPPRAGGTAAGARAYFVDAYNKKRKEAEEARRREEEEQRSRRDDEGDRRHADEGGRRPEERKRREEEPTQKSHESSVRVGGGSGGGGETRKGQLTNQQRSEGGRRAEPEPPSFHRSDRRERREERRDERPATADRREDRRDERKDDRREEATSASSRHRRSGDAVGGGSGSGGGGGGRRDDERRSRHDEHGGREGGGRFDMATRDEGRRDEGRRDEGRRDNRDRYEAERQREDEARRRRDDERRREDDRRRREQEEEGRRRRDEEKQKKEEERRRHEQELQRKRDDKRKEEDEKRRKEQEVRREETEQRRREERRKQDELAARKAEEDRVKRDEEAKAMRQQQATLAVLRVLQHLSNANPENFAQLKRDLAQVMQTELPETGPQQEEVLKAEAARVLEYAQQYVDQIRQQQLQQQKKMEEEEAVARELLQELEHLVAVAEAASESVHYTAAPLLGDNELEDAQVFKVSRAVEEAGNTAIAACSNCADFLSQKRAAIDEAEHLRSQTQAIITVLRPRIQAATRQATEALQQAKSNKETVMRKVGASRRLNKGAAVFQKYDKDGDGFLSLQDVAEYALGEFQFELNPPSLEKIGRQIFSDPKGIGREDFQLMKTAVGISRDEHRGRQRRLEREEQERLAAERAAARQVLVAEKKVQFSGVANQLSTMLIERAEPAIQQAEAVAEGLAGEAADLEISALRTAGGSVEGAAASAELELADIKQRIEGLCSDVGEMHELTELMKPELTDICGRAEGLDSRLAQVRATARGVYNLANHRILAEYESVRMEVATTLRSCHEAQGGKLEDLFDSICKNGALRVSKANIMDYLKAHQCDLEEEKLEKVFPLMSDESLSVEGTDKNGVVEAPADNGGAENVPMEGDLSETKGGASDESKGGSSDGVLAGAETSGATEAIPVVSDESVDIEGKETADHDSAAELASRQTGCAKDTIAILKVTEVVDGITELVSTDDVSASTVEEAHEGKLSAPAGDAPAERSSVETSATEVAVITPVAASLSAIESDIEMRPATVADVEEAPQAANNDTSLSTIPKTATKPIASVGVSPTISREIFVRFVRVYYKVVKEIVLSDNLHISQSRQIRRMQVGEVMEVTGGPALDPSIGIYRVGVRAFRDGLFGWVTVAGNQGVTFLLPGGSIFRVLQPTTLSSELRDLEGASLVKNLAEGDILEVLEWARTSRSTLGVTRVRAKVQGCNSLGWATITGNDGNVYLEAT
eukprot:TRINITY_DN11825_c0_g1_i2.p1 TRINITY_DN11825_c0_g1~~TRINITY_DN11825_c0_g1_i2.p1  ORF type:complete len:1658 (-),score=400.74 TRINITY_DN11825_c0_g1_i2:139-5112(-)